MSTFVYVTLVALAFFGPRILAWARTADWSDYHLAHGPKSGCLECVDK